MANIPGTAGDDTLIGTPQDDIITTDTGNDTVTADAGDDLIIVDEDGQGTIDGGAGYDTIQLTSDVYGFSNFNSTALTGDLFTSIGSYVFENVERVEAYDTSANLTYLSLVGDSGADVLDGSIENPLNQQALYGLGGNDTLIAGSTYTALFGGEGDDTLTGGAGDAEYYGGLGADTITAGVGFNAIYYFHSLSAITIDLSGVNANTGGDAQGDILSGHFDFVVGSNFDDNITGSAFDESLDGSSGADIIDGGAGDDLLNGGQGADTLTGGAGNDIFNFFQFDSVFSDTITDFAIGDRVGIHEGVFNGNFTVPTFIGTAAFSSVAGEMRYVKSNGQTLIELDSNGDGLANETLTLSNGEHDLLLVNAQSYSFQLIIDTSVNGTPGPDTLNGTVNDDIINGLGGNDTITTLTGNDIIDGGDGDDIIIGDEAGSGSINGGAGTDVFQVTYASNGFGSYFDENQDALLLSTQGGGYELTDVERYEALDTSGNVTQITLSGNSDANVIDASAEAATINSLVVWGAGGADTLTGSAHHDQLFGGSGNDIIYGLDSGDSLNGDEGDDQLFGGAGNDNLSDNHGVNILDGGAGVDSASLFNFNSGQGVVITATSFDTLVDATSGTSWQLNDVEYLNYHSTDDDDIIDLTGFTQSDVIEFSTSSNAGQDSVILNTITATFNYAIESYSTGFFDGDAITGFDFDDVLIFSNFNDTDGIDLTFIGTAAFSNYAGEIRYTKNAADTVLELDRDGDGTADETLTFTEVLDLQVNQYFSNGAESGQLVIGMAPPPIDGTAGNDTLLGTPDDDVINGFAGNDIITTFTGTDTVDAGTGDDIVIISVGSQGNIDGGDGYDILRVESTTLPPTGAYIGNPDDLAGFENAGLLLPNFERAELINSATGEYFVLSLIGTNGVDNIDISAENIQSGGTFNVATGDGNDVVNVGANTDVHVQAFLGAGDDTITVGDNGSFVDGGLGADTITGGAGVDFVSYETSSVGVTVDLSAGTAVGGTAQGDVLTGIEGLFGSNTGNNTLVGDANDNSIYGGALSDVIEGGDGDDVIFSGLGIDTMSGGAGNDVFFTLGEYQGAFTGTITDFEIGDSIGGTVNFQGPAGFFQISWLGENAFTGAIGELRYEKTGGQTLIQMDTTGDGVADETLTVTNGEFDLTNVSVEPGAFDLKVVEVIAPNLITTTADEIAEDTDLQTQGNDGTGLSLREAIAIANTDAAADTLTYDANVTGQITNTSPNGSLLVTEDLTVSSGITIFHESFNNVFEISNGATLISGADIFADNTSSSSFFNFGNGILISDANGTFTNLGTINTDSFGPNNEDRSGSILIGGQNATVNNAAGASIVSQGRYAVYSFDFDDNTNDYIPDFLTINNDGLLEAGDDVIRIGTGEINNSGTISSRGEIDFGGIWTPPGLASDGIAIVNQLDSSFVPGPDGVLVINNTATGLIEGPRAGINFSGGGTINNAGTITGETTGFFTAGNDDFSNIFILNNSGTVSAGSADYGLIDAEFRGGVTVFGGLDVATITNSGTISSGYYGIYSREGIDITNTTTGQIIGDTDGTGDDDVSFYGAQLVDFEVEISSSFRSPFGLSNFISTQNVTIDGNGNLVTSVGTYLVPTGQIEMLFLTNVDAPSIMPLVDLVATQAAGEIVFQTDANGTVFPASVNVTTASNGILTVTYTSGQPFTVTDVSGNTVYVPSTTADYGDSIDNNGFLSGDVITGLGNDSIINRGDIADDIFLGEGNDNYTAGAAGLSGDIYGGAGNDIINARTGNQSIFGEDGNDFLRGGEGNDTLHGGFGADWLRGGEGADVLNGFAGTDWADYITSSSAVTVDLLAGVGTAGDAQGDTYLFIERVYGSNHDDTITGDNGVNYLRGAGGNDTLNGGVGNDYLQGDAGADVINGGAGSDFAYYASSSVGLTIDLGTPSNSTGEAAGDSYISVENILGSNYDDIIYGDAANNFLRGLKGNDQLFGGDGADFLRGDQGADVLDGGDGLDWAYYAASSGAVTVDLSTGTASGADAAGDTFISIERLFGSVFGDTFTGDTGSNYLRGFTGNDTLNGGAGTDFLQGDAGADALDGGAGTDWAFYVSARTGVTVDIGDSNNNTGEAAGDTYISIESLRGSNFDDDLTGDSGTNFIVGGSGDDTLNGGAGNDTLRGDAGADTFVFESGTFRDTVIDYNDAEDMLDFSSFGFTSAADALSNAVDTAGGDVVFTIGSDEIIIEDTTIADIMDNLII